MAITVQRRYRVDPPVAEQGDVESRLTSRLSKHPGVGEATVKASLSDEDHLIFLFIDVAVEADEAAGAAVFVDTAIRGELTRLGVDPEHLELVDDATTA